MEEWEVSAQAESRVRRRFLLLYIRSQLLDSPMDGNTNKSSAIFPLRLQAHWSHLIADGMAERSILVDPREI